MHLNLPRFLIVFLLLPLAVVLAGCGTAEREEVTPDGRVVIEWYNYATPEFLELWKQLIAEFEETHPHIKVRLNASLGDTGYDAKLLTLLAGGIPPDVIHVTQQNFPFYAAKGLLVDVRPLAEADPEFDLNDYFEPVLDAMDREGELLGLPSDFSTIVMFYNKTIFDKQGIPYPAEDWDWDDFLDTCRKLTVDEDRDGAPDQFGFSNQYSYNRWPAWVWMSGGDLFNEDKSRSLMDSPEAVEGFAFYTDLSNRWNVSPAPGQETGLPPEDLFLSQRIAMMANSRYAYKSFSKGTDFQWDLAPMPKGQRRATTLIWGGNCILKTTKHPEECWEFLKFLSGHEGAMANVRMGNALPAYKPVALKPGILRTKVSAPNDVEFLRAIEYAQAAYAPAQFADYTQALSELQDVSIGLVSPEEGCRRFARQVNRLLQEPP